MKLDLEKFTKLSKTADLNRCTGKFSDIYVELDKAWDVIADLLLIKKATQKTIVKLLQEAGMKELKMHNFNGWWSKKSTQLKRNKFLAELPGAKQKRLPMEGIASGGKLKKGFE